MHDKYTGKDFVIDTADAVWVIQVCGISRVVKFADGPTGSMQKALVLVSGAQKSPATLDTRARGLVRHWSYLYELLSAGPLAVKANWDPKAQGIGEAELVRRVLEAACVSNMGPWTPQYLPLVKALRSAEKSSYKKHRGRVTRREVGVPVSVQAEVASMLDRAAATSTLTVEQLEGLVALVLVFQHGVRPVEAMALRVEHVRVFTDAQGDPAAIVSFHIAKQRGEGRTFEKARAIRPEWVSLVSRLKDLAVTRRQSQLFEVGSAANLTNRSKYAARDFGVNLKHSFYDFRHTAAQALADAGHSRASIREFLGHASDASANAYVTASLGQAQLINKALGASKLYSDILRFSENPFITTEEVLRAPEDQQIGAIVGHRLVAGVGLCGSGQTSCAYNPVTSCYGCEKFMPSLDRQAHEEAVAGMREQVVEFLNLGMNADAPAYRQLTTALAGAQSALQAIAQLEGKKNDND